MTKNAHFSSIVSTTYFGRNNKYPMNTSRVKKLSDTKGLENYIHYAVDTEGNVYSNKNRAIRKLRPGWAKHKNGYLFVRLADIYGNRKNFFVHRLVCMCFIPCDDFTLKVNHINKNIQDNRLENLEWIIPKETPIPSTTVKGFTLDDHIVDKIKQVHIASIRKGLTVPDGYSFLNNIIETALEQHINQYGLRKVMN